MARRSNLTNLIYDAFNSPGEGGATASNRNWVATRMGNYVGVAHHGTHMFNVSRAGVVEPVDSGHGSTSDRCGVRRITAGFGCGGPHGVGYRELYAEDAPPEDSMSGDQWRSPLRDAGVIDTIRQEIHPGLERRPPNVQRPPAQIRRPGTHSGLAGDDFRYSDMNLRGPDYSQPDPFDFSDPEEARQAQSIADMEETLQDFDERDQAAREWRRSEQ